MKTEYQRPPDLQALVYDKLEGKKIWMGVLHKCRTLEGVRKIARRNVKSGIWAGYRLVTIHEEHFGGT